VILEIRGEKVKKESYYEVIIKTKDKTRKEKIEDLKQLKELLQPYIKEKIEVELHEKGKTK